MTNHIITYIPIELIGGPRDGERVMWIDPPPAVIVVAVPGETTLTHRDSSLSNAPAYLHVGEYRPQPEQSYQRIGVDYELVQKGADVLVNLLTEATDLLEYDWCGEG